jgi:hypothetical protein
MEQVYNDDHVPTAVDKLVDKTKMVATKVLGSSLGTLVPRGALI